MKYKITTYRNGKARRRYFDSLKEATKVAGEVFRRTGVVLGIEEVKGKNHARKR